MPIWNTGSSFLSWWNHFSMETEFVLVTKCYQWFFGAIFVVAKKVVIPWWCCSNQFKIFRRFFVSWLRIGWSFSEDLYSKSFAICIASRARALLVHGVDFSLGVALLLQLSMEDVMILRHEQIRNKATRTRSLSLYLNWNLKFRCYTSKRQEVAPL